MGLSPGLGFATIPQAVAVEVGLALFGLPGRFAEAVVCAAKGSLGVDRELDHPLREGEGNIVTQGNVRPQADRLLSDGLPRPVRDDEAPTAGHAVFHAPLSGIDIAAGTVEEEAGDALPQ